MSMVKIEEIKKPVYKKRFYSTTFNIQGIDIKRKNRLLKVCYVPTTSATFLAIFSFFHAVAINSANEANKAGGTRH
jgi:hypothetical protein